jgi:hypothetical protein
MWIALLVCGSVVLAIVPRSAPAQPLDVERVLAERFGLSADELAQVRGGQHVVKTLPASESEIAVGGVVRIPDDKDRLVRWIRDIEGFRKAADLGMARKLSSPPAINDFGDLALDSGELAALAKCQPGDCGLRLGDRAIAQFQQLDWSAADVGRRANLLARQLMLGYAEAYLRGGDEALGSAHNERQPRVVADGFRALIRDAVNLRAMTGPLAAYLEQYPKVQLPGVEEFLYWSKGGLGPDPAITLHHLVIHRDGGGVYIADKQLYASRYVDTGLLLLWLAPPPDGKGYYLLAGLRARSTMLDGFAARLLRGRIEETSRSDTEIYLDWIRKSLTPVR